MRLRFDTKDARLRRTPLTPQLQKRYPKTEPCSARPSPWRGLIAGAGFLLTLVTLWLDWVITAEPFASAPVQLTHHH